MRRPIEGRGTKSSQNDGPSSVAVSVLDKEWKRPPPPITSQPQRVDYNNCGGFLGLWGHKGPPSVRPVNNPLD